MALQSDIEETLLCFLRRGRPLTHKELGTELKASQPTVRRRVSALREQGWLLNHLGGLGGDLLLLNVNRAGFKSFTDYLYTEYEVTVGPYLWAVDNAGKFRRQMHHVPRTTRQGEEERLARVVSQAAEAVDSADGATEIKDRDVREYAEKARELWSTAGRLESKMSRIARYDSSEQVRSTHRLLGDLSSDLIFAKDGFYCSTAQENLLWLALVMRNNAVVYEKYARGLNLAAQRGAERAEVSDRLAGWALDCALPGTAPHSWTLRRYYRLVGEGELLRELDDCLYNNELPQVVLHEPFRSGHAGEIVLAQDLYDTVGHLWELIEEIRVIPSMEPLFSTQDVADEFARGPVVEIRSDGYPVPKIEELRETWTVASDDLRENATEDAPEREVDGAQLKTNDQLIRVAGNPVPGEPVVAANDGDTLLLAYEGATCVRVKAQDFTAERPCVIRRPE